MMSLALRNGCEAPDEVGALFSEYTELLIAGDPAFQAYLELQNYAGELVHLEEKYSRPAGRLYLADWDGALAGCVALRRLDDARCEMKRLYVRPEFRGRHIARALTERILEDAREIGYRAMVLDTLPCLDGAVRLYEKLGFYRIDGYNDNPMENAVYMQKDL